jgi:hypothetical protein
MYPLMSGAVEWLLVSGVLPLFGAGVLSLVIGGVIFALLERTYWWSNAEIADPMGWLYGAAAIGVESALKIQGVPGDRAKYLYIFSWVAVVTSAVLLLIAMTVRGMSAWKFEIPFRFKVVAFGLTVATLTMGFRVHFAQVSR